MWHAGSTYLLSPQVGDREANAGRLVGGIGRVRTGKWLVVVLTSLALSGCGHQSRGAVKPGDAAPAAAVPGIQWLSDYQAGVSQAQQQGKPLMVQVSAPWCSSCKRLEADVLSRPDVIAASRAFVPVRLDGDKRPDLKKQLDVSGYPTVIFLRGGKEIGRVRGPVPYQQFLVMLKEMAKAGRPSR